MISVIRFSVAFCITYDEGASSVWMKLLAHEL